MVKKSQTDKKFTIKEIMLATLSTFPHFDHEIDTSRGHEWQRFVPVNRVDERRMGLLENLDTTASATQVPTPNGLVIRAGE